MNETKSSVLEETATFEITGIEFEGGDPCKPRYKGLYKDSSHTPAQLEPSFQLANTVRSVSVTLALNDSRVEFVEEPNANRPLGREMGQRDADPKATIEYGADPSRCVLTWETSPNTTKVFRIYCKKKGGEFTVEQKVYGGLFVAFSTHPANRMDKEIAPERPGPIDHLKIHLLGADDRKRPVYDVHQDALTVPEDVELEPAYRVLSKQPLELRLIMKIRKARWNREPRFPLGRPGALTYRLEDPAETSFLFEWRDESREGRAVTFHLVPELSPEVFSQPLPEDLAQWETWERYAEALQYIGVDPTIIQPPVCDPVYNVCAV